MLASGVDVGPVGSIATPVANTTVLKMSRVGTTIFLYVNGVVYTHSIAGVTTAPLFVDTALFENAGTLGPITMVNS